MKKSVTILVFIYLSFNLFAQSPPRMSYQCVIRNNNGDLLKNHDVGLRISILQGSLNGIVVYQETFNPLPHTNADGLLSLEIGGGVASTGQFTTIKWVEGPFFLKTETDPSGGTNYSISGTSQLLSVPFALYAESSGNIELLESEISMLRNTMKAGGVVKDIEGNAYNTVVIGTQTWMSENLKTTKYYDGSAIPLVTDNTDWSNLREPGFCWYNNDEASNKNVYGALYNWFVVNTGKLCPVGWHVPSNDEWSVLITYLGGSPQAGGKLKESGTLHWKSPNTGATNESGFTALPGGLRTLTGIFLPIKESCNMTSSTPEYSLNAWDRVLKYNQNDISKSGSAMMNGYSIRCLMNQ